MSKELEIVRDADLIAHEIRGIKEHVRRVAGLAAAEIGQKLTEAKEMMPHGEWGDWLKREVDYSQSTAINLMKIYETFGSDSKMLGGLDYTKALALTGLSEDAREELLAESNVEDMSTRELQAAVKAKEEAEKELQAAKEREEAEKLAREALEAALAEASEKQREHDEQVAKLTADLASAEAAQDDVAGTKAKEQLKKTKEELAAAKKRAKELEAELKAKPIDIPKIEEKIVEVVPEAVTKELEQLRQREQELAKQAKEREETAAKQLAELHEQLRKNNNVAGIKVKVHFKALNDTFQELMTAVGELTDEEQKKAVKGRIAAVCDEIKASTV